MSNANQQAGAGVAELRINSMALMDAAEQVSLAMLDLNATRLKLIAAAVALKEAALAIETMRGNAATAHPNGAKP